MRLLLSNANKRMLLLTVEYHNIGLRDIEKYEYSVYTYAYRTLYVVVEHAVLVPVPVEEGDGLGRLEVLHIYMHRVS